MTTRIRHIIRAAELGGRIHRKYFGTQLATKQKTIASDLQTRADIESERAVVKYLRKHFPRYSITAEEETQLDNKSDYGFVIDPLDGTRNFVMGIPYFSVSIALTYRGKVIAGAVHHSSLQKTYYAELGKGAFCNGVRLRVNKVNEIERASIVYTCGYTTDRRRVARQYNKLFHLDVSRIVNNWSPALDYCLLASGRIEAVVQYGNEYYDYFAGLLIAREAGAKITDLKGKKPKSDAESYILSSNNTTLHRVFLKAV
ncbi:MAG: inositol monophosphatase [Candidatus Nomurabacteria bacterium]|nr:MAG: inositol monophosphatase [Candidatus Nomurabacteria bacterium]